ncbi:Glyco-trans-2-like domain-containing protein [Mycena indigotica]|uniref:Glyco-trans-2-like domain-containing protein n=1 Tax=Mycena indigotica TaxID=2126181 RepID=A0A8H6W2P2_9AGAR|nr:Glyco-trans-2-like domain-containing protein [Mycena indigotica]KAF7297159.1 Glyco-trans-2-like domain-containing protein [Mycena indigotica]
MDYDRYDALLHYLFKQTQGDAWFRPDEPVSSGIALRVSDGTVAGGSSGGNTPTGQPSSPEFRVFPYENSALEPFEAAVAALNPQVAVKVRSAAVHAALAELYVLIALFALSLTRIQGRPTKKASTLTQRRAFKYSTQCFSCLMPIKSSKRLSLRRDERVLVVWSDSIDAIIPTCQDFEDRLIKLLWRSRPTGPLSTPGSISGSILSHSSLAARPFDSEKQAGLLPDQEKLTKAKVRRNWYGKKVGVETTIVAADVESGLRDRRDAKLYAPIYNGLAAGLSFVFIGNGINTILQEWSLDGEFIRFALFALCPLLWCVSLFFALQLIQNITMWYVLISTSESWIDQHVISIGPVAHFHENSKFYSAIKPRANKMVDERLPHITIQMPVYKESLLTVLAPSIESIKKAMQTYARQGGTSSIFVNDDGLRLLSGPDRDERLAFYAHHNIGWVARPKHDGSSEGFKRAGRFKKASNMNYGLALSLKMEKHLEALVDAAGLNAPVIGAGATPAAGSRTGSVRGGFGNHAIGMPHRMSLSSTGFVGSDSRSVTFAGQYGLQYQNRDGDDMATLGMTAALGDGFVNLGAAEELEERALAMAMEETYVESGKRFRPWAANGRSCRIGEFILIVDSDTVVPEDCLRDAAREMTECPTVGIIQHESDVMQVAHHYFENGIAYFTRRINRCISMACANGEVAPFMGHNAFLRWKALQDAAFVDVDGKEKIWSESNVSEDFDMALRLLLRGYIIRWATYSKGGFKEGVSLTIDDELNRWQKYAYGCSELLFHPLIQWWRRGPVTHQIHQFLWCKAAPMHYKISMMAYMFSYYGIAASVTIGLINYVLLGFQFPVDGFYRGSFEIWLACTIVFFGTGTVGYTLLEYRLGHKDLIFGFILNLKWIPFFFFFFGGLGIPVSQAILAHLFSYNIQWSATIKEVQRSNFFKEIPKICKRFWFPLLVSFIIIAGMIIVSTNLVPLQWRVSGDAWGVIFPLAVVAACHILFPIVLNPWLMVFSY